MRIEKTLVELRDRLRKAQEELRILEEQIMFQAGVMEEAKVRMVVSETPLADREYRIARDDYERLIRQRTDVTTEIADLQKQQDRLLDRMLNA